MIETGLKLDWLDSHLQGATYNSNVVFQLLFMVDTDIVGANWVELPAGSYELSQGVGTSHCQIEAHVHYEKLISHAPEGKLACQNCVCCCPTLRKKHDRVRC